MMASSGGGEWYNHRGQVTRADICVKAKNHFLSLPTPLLAQPPDFLSLTMPRAKPYSQFLGIPGGSGHYSIE